ncbi:PKD domain-containing protein, partial [bacterium AH-315-M05]|nr:PKD domain-containing protein [bacterium AH-315-M05]
MSAWLFPTLVSGPGGGAAFSQCITNIDFNTWIQEGDPANGTWTVGGGGSWVNQSINGNPTFFVSPDTFINVIITGTITPPSSDDDFIGFVFGYNEPIGNSSNYDCWLFDWKQGIQTLFTYTGQEGQSLNHIQGNITNVEQYFWGHTNNPPLFDVVATNWGAGTGWVNNTTYQFTLVYTTTNTIILIDGDTIFNVTGCFKQGRFGFYNYSQPDVTYADFNYRLKVEFTFPSSQICLGDAVLFQSVDTSCSNIASNLVSWDWDFGDGSFSTDTNPSHVYLAPGTYTVQLIVTDYLGCNDTTTKNIVVSPLPSANFTSTDVCLNQTNVFTDISTISSGAITQWQWDFGDGLGVSSIQNPTYTYSIPGTFTVTLTVTSDSGCTDVVSSPVEVYPLPLANFTTANVCLSDSAVFVDISTISSGFINSWQWDFGDGNTSIIQNPSHLYADSGTYNVILTVTSDQGCIDSITQTITIYPLTIGGIIFPNATVCSGANYGILMLINYSGNVLYWEYSIDGGITWTNIANTTDTLSYSNLTTTTIYHAVVLDVGLCPPASSYEATVIVLNPLTVGGTIFSDTTMCSGSNIGTLILTGHTGNVLYWEYSTDGGVTWTNIANTTTLQSYNNLTTTTIYRALVESGICPDSYSTPATITVDPVSVGGAVGSNATVCSGLNSGILTLTGHSGNIIRWEYSTDGGGTWVVIANGTTTQTYSNLTTTTMYRAVVQSGTVCPSENSTSATITVDPVSVGGAVGNDSTVCSGLNNGTLKLSGYTGNILNWEFSTDTGLTWINIVNTTDTLSYNNLTTITFYRAMVQSGVCPPDTSSYAAISIFP